jgi:Cu+-exporting ATPase
MTIDPAKAAGTSEYDGKRYYFCGKGCKAKFDLDPGRYAGPGFGIRDSGSVGFEVRHAPAGSTKWTCPMHPEIVRDDPGSCPICGMAIEQMNVTAEEPEN